MCVYIYIYIYMYIHIYIYIYICVAASGGCVEAFRRASRHANHIAGSGSKHRLVHSSSNEHHADS